MFIAVPFKIKMIVAVGTRALSVVYLLDQELAGEFTVLEATRYCLNAGMH